MKLNILAYVMAGALTGAALIKADEPSGRGFDGAVYTIDNAPGGNNVLIFQRHADGTLSPAGTAPTGGLGTGTGLGSEGAVLLTRDGRWLFAVNAGSDEITAFAVTQDGLQLSDKVPSDGRLPLSLTVHDDLLYVLNGGGALGDQDNITGFRFSHGHLAAIPGSTRALSAANTSPAQVSFSSDGDVLIVTEKATSIIDTFTVGDQGVPEDHKVFASPATTPFGFASGRQNRIFISNADSSSLSSYQVSEDGEVTLISDAIANTQKAACWVALTENNRFAYTANAASGTISGYRIDRHSQVQLIDPDGRTGLTGNGSHPIDMALSNNSRFLYSLNNGNGTIVAFEVGADGSLQSIGSVGGISTAASGLAAH